MLLLKTNTELKKAFGTLVKTIKVPVTWTETFVILNNSLILAGDVRSLILNFDTKKVSTNIIEIPPESSRLESMPNDPLLNNAMNIALYAFGKWGNVSGLKVEKDYDALNALFTSALRPVNIEPQLNKENLRFFKNGMQVTYEDTMLAILRLLKNEGKLKEGQSLATSDASPEDGASSHNAPGQNKSAQIDEPEDDDYKIGLWHNLCWKKDACDFQKAPQGEGDVGKSRIGNDFYITNYLCPNCGEKLYLGVYPTDKELLIETEEGRVFMARTYACRECNTLYTPRPEKLIQEGDVYSLKFDEDTVAFEDYLDILGEKAARTTNYKFNEFESSRNSDAKKESGKKSFKDQLFKSGKKLFAKNKKQATLQEQAPAPQPSEIAGSATAFEEPPEELNPNENIDLERQLEDEKKLLEESLQEIPLEKPKQTLSELLKAASQAAEESSDLDAQAPAQTAEAASYKAAMQLTAPVPAATANAIEPIAQPASHETAMDAAKPAKQPSIQEAAMNATNPAKQPSSHEATIDTAKPTKQSSSHEAAMNAAKPTKQPSSHEAAIDTAKPAKQPAAPMAKKNETAPGNQSPAQAPAKNATKPAQSKVRLSTMTVEELKVLLIKLKRADESAKAQSATNATYGEYINAVIKVLHNKLIAKYDAHMASLDKLTLSQVSDLKRQIEKETVLSNEEKQSYGLKLDSRQNRAKEIALGQTIELSKNKTYAEIGQIIDDVESLEIPEEAKQDALKTLQRIKSDRAVREVEHLLTHMPLHMDRKQLSAYIDNLSQYKDIDLTPYRKQLEQRMDMAETEEISAMVNRGGKKDRTALWNLYEQLQQTDYHEKNKEPFLDKIYEKIRRMDESKIESICPSIVALSFTDGIKAYEQISHGVFLPELKTNTLEMITRRLTKLKTDESVQLMRKLKRDIEEKLPERESFYFYDAREEAKKAQSAQTPDSTPGSAAESPDAASGQNESHNRTAMLRAVKGYASSRGQYEYPLMVCDTSRARNGKEGFVLTPDHIFSHTFMNSEKISVADIDKIKAVKKLFGKGIFIETFGGQKIKLPNNLSSKYWKAFADILDGFVDYLQEKPESRSIEYMAKEKHDLIRCYRCGYAYKGTNACPRCGSKMNS